MRLRIYPICVNGYSPCGIDTNRMFVALNDHLPELALIAAILIGFFGVLLFMGVLFTAALESRVIRLTADWIRGEKRKGKPKRESEEL